MKANKMAKIFSVIILTIIIMTASLPNAYAISDIFSGADGFIQNGEAAEAQSPAFDDSAMQSTIDTIYNTLLIIGVIVAAFVGIFLGLQFITGSVEQKSKIKESIIPYVAGCAVIFGAFGIWRLVIIILR